jgi:hypothetical protein
MPKPAKPTPEFIKECFNYNPETGELLWKERPRSHFRSDKDHAAWNRRYPGKLPGYINYGGPNRNRPRTVVLSHPDWDDYRGYDCNRACAVLLGYELTDETLVGTRNGDMSDLRGDNIWVLRDEIVPGRFDSLTLQEYLNECFEADFESGELCWKLRPRDHFSDFKSWNRHCKAKVGKRAEVDSSDGKYFLIGVKNDRLFPNGSMSAHRALWTMKHGEIADGLVIDHINGDGRDNRISNLRMVTQGENTLNRKCRSRSNLLPKNVNKVKGGYSVSFGVNAGFYRNEGAASESSIFASRRWFGEFSREHGGAESDYDGEPLAIKVRKFLSGEIDEIIHKKKASPIAE